MEQTVEQLAESLKRSGLVPDLDVAAAVAGEPQAADDVTGVWLLDRLTASRQLTEYQREAVSKGRIDDLLLGNYTIVSAIGAGGMGEVFKAVHRRMKRQVAIKVLLFNKKENGERVALFQTEIETMAQLSHPNMVAAYDADECRRGADLVMELVSGSDLSNLVKTQGRRSLRQAADWIAQAARGLQYAHSQGVVHGDIKPANLLLSDDGTLKITDLGLARLMKRAEPADSIEAIAGGHDAAASNQPQAIVGTVGYMPPEQAFHTDVVDHRADIYSLGCTLYFLLTGQTLFQERNILVLLRAHRDRPRPLLRDSRPDVPPELEAIYLRMVAPLLVDRFSSMAEVVEALEACDLPDPFDHAESAAESKLTAIADDPTTCCSASALMLKGANVLLVEHSRLQSRLISGQMAELGVPTIRTAASGAEAWEAMLSQCPDVVVSAMHLPDMTGADLIQRMRNHPVVKEAAFVLISSETDYGLLEPVRQAGTAAILPKPFGLPGLRQALIAAIDFSPNAVKAHNLQLTGLKVLLVDDSRSARSHVRRVLENLGAEDFTEAVNGIEAIQHLSQTQFDLIVTDWHMPECDGLALTQHIRRDPRHRQVPVLMITSETDTTLLADAIRRGVSAVCAKVFDPQAVAKILISLLDARRAGSAT